MERTSDTGAPQPSTEKPELTDKRLLELWFECDRDPLRFAYRLREIQPPKEGSERGAK